MNLVGLIWNNAGDLKSKLYKIINKGQLSCQSYNDIFEALRVLLTYKSIDDKLKLSDYSIVKCNNDGWTTVSSEEFNELINQLKPVFIN